MRDGKYEIEVRDGVLVARPEVLNFVMRIAREALQREIDDARRAAFEEAAKAASDDADAWPALGRSVALTIARRIRALAGEEAAR
jgi:hypothetical protein